MSPQPPSSYAPAYSLPSLQCLLVYVVFCAYIYAYLVSYTYVPSLLWLPGFLYLYSYVVAYLASYVCLACLAYIQYIKLIQFPKLRHTQSVMYMHAVSPKYTCVFLKSQSYIDLQSSQPCQLPSLSNLQQASLSLLCLLAISVQLAHSQHCLLITPCKIVVAPRACLFTLRSLCLINTLQQAVTA